MSELHAAVTLDQDVRLSQFREKLRLVHAQIDESAFVDLVEGEQASRTVAPELLRDPLVAHLLKCGNIGVGAWPFVDPNIYGLEVNGLRTAHRAPNGLTTRFLQ